MLETARLWLREVACANSSSSAAGCARSLASRGLRSVAAEGFQAPGVVVSYTDDAGSAQR